MYELCLHIYAPAHTRPMLRKFQLVMGRAQRVLISTPKPRVDEVRALVDQGAPDADVEIIGVDNTYNDWSGFLGLFSKVTADRLIFGNDSLINRRLIRKADLVQLAGLVESAKRPSLIGELDTGRVSVPVGGYSSTAWVSSFLFGMYLADGIDAQNLGRSLTAQCDTIPAQTRDFFLTFLRQRRPGLLKANPDGGGKLHAMYLERLLTHHAATNQFDIVSQYGGSWNRKVYRLIESKFL